MICWRLLDLIFLTKHFKNLQAAAAAKIQLLAIKFLHNRAARFCTAVNTINCFYHSITGPKVTDGMRLATASPRRMV